MTTKAQKIKTTRNPKYPTQQRKRCLECYRDNIIRFGRCRLCFIKRADRGELTGIAKVSS